MPTTRLALAAAILAPMLAAPAAIAQDLERRPPPQDAPIAIVHATIHPISAPAIPDGYVLFDKGLITEVGSMTGGGGGGGGAGGGRAFSATTRLVDAKGKHVYPGLISPWTHMGLIEIQSIRPSNDTNEIGDFSPEALAVVSVNPDSTFIPVARVNGVLACGVFPTGGTFPGRASVIRMDGWTTEDLAVRADAGIILNWPVMRTISAWWMDQNEDEQRRNTQRALDQIKDTLKAARSYLAQKDSPLPPGAAPIPTDIRYEALRHVLAAPPTPPGALPLPVLITANDYDQITAAVTWAAQEKLRAVIVGGRDAPLAAAILKKHDVPVIINSPLLMPKRDDSPIDEAYTIAARLEAAGVRWCIASGEETAHERNLPYAAALAVAHGLDHDAALRGITLSAAQILGVDDTLGSLQPGKEATLFIASGSPLEVTTAIDAIYIRGRPIALTTKQTELADKYREKYRQIGKPAPAPATPSAPAKAP